MSYSLKKIPKSSQRSSPVTKYNFMKTINLFFVLSLILVSACSTTKSYPPEFYGYTPEEQRLIRNGQIAVGFNENQVRMALGNPSSVARSSGESYFWTYKKLQPRDSAVQRIGGAIARGSDPIVPASGPTFYNKLNKRVTFESSTQTVTGFQTY